MGMFDGKTVLITGGSRNTGLYITEKFYREGARVFMCGSTPESTAAGVGKTGKNGRNRYPGDPL